MPDETQKNQGSNKTRTSTKHGIYDRLRKPQNWLLLKVFGFCIVAIAANGLLPRPFTVIVVFFFITAYIINEFVNERKKFTPGRYWFSLSFSILFFVGICAHLFVGYLDEESNNQKLTNENVFLRDSLAKIQDSVYKLKDSIQNIKTFLAIAETTKTNANEKLDLAMKYFGSKSKPILSVGNFSLDTLAVGKPIHISCQIENVGGTTAKKIGLYQSATCRPTLDWSNFPLNIERAKEAPNLAPTKSYIARWTSDQLLGEELFTLLRAKKSHLYYFGITYYYDDFNKKDSTGFCVILDPLSPKTYRYNQSHNF